MKKSILLAVCILLMHTYIKSQNVPNGSFENWTLKTFYEQPNYWGTANSQLLMQGMQPNCTKDLNSFAGTYAAKLETVTNGHDTVNGIMFIGQPGNHAINGGYPFAAHPDSVVVHLKYNIMLHDTGHFIIFFKNSGIVTGMAWYNMIGAHLGWGTFKLPVTWYQLGNSDTLSAIITSSNLDYPDIPGSYVYIDNISLISSAVPFPNGGFEDWTANTSEEPDGWQTLNYAKTTVPSATKVSGYIGSYAIRVETIQTFWGQTLGYVTNGIMGNNGPAGGIPVNLNPSNLTGFYKYIPNGLDTAIALVKTSRYDITLHTTIPVEMFAIKLPPVNTYTPFQINLNYSGFPFVDTVNITFASSNLMDSGAYVGVGSALYLDSLNMNFLPLFVNKANENQEINVFPNPANTYVAIDLKNYTGKSSFIIFDALGRKLMTNEFDISNNLKDIDVSQLNNGLYFIQVRLDDGNIFMSKFIVNR